MNMTMIAVAWICLGLGMAMGFTLGRWMADTENRGAPIQDALESPCAILTRRDRPGPRRVRPAAVTPG